MSSRKPPVPAGKAKKATPDNKKATPDKTSVVASPKRDWSRLEAFLKRIQGEIYPEPPSGLHTELTRRAIAFLFGKISAPRPLRILDVGCGQGVALEQFKALGHRPLGVAMGEDVRVCRGKGLEAIEMDLASLEFPDREFDLVWCRHSLEHSIFPFFTLAELYRVLRPGGLVYVEVPAPDTSCRHQTNPNHYSVMGRSMWLSLMTRAGFEVVHEDKFEFTVPAGPDTYWAFILRRPVGADETPALTLTARFEAGSLALQPQPAKAAAPAPAPAAAPAPSRQPVMVQFTASSFFGWGVYGLNLALHWADDPEVFPLFTLPFRMEEIVIDPMRRGVLGRVIAESENVRGTIFRGIGRTGKINAPVLSALSEQLSPFRSANVPFLEGSANIGIIFFLDTKLTPAGFEEARRNHLIVAGSSWNRDVLLANGIAQTRLVIQGIDPTQFHVAERSAIMGDTFTIFSGGKLEYRKAQDLVLLAFKRFRERHPESVLVTAWHSPWPGVAATMQINSTVPIVPFTQKGQVDVRAWAASVGIPPESVVDLGAVPNAEIAPILREMDVGLFPNRCEPGTNLVAMECMACGMPLVISRNTGHTDIMGADNCYPLDLQRPVPPCPPIAMGTEGWGESDLDEIVERLEEVWRDRAESRKRGLAGAARMAQLSWGNQIGELKEVIQPFFAKR